MDLLSFFVRRLGIIDVATQKPALLRVFHLLQ